MTSDGLTAWTADASGALNGYANVSVLPDFQGGVVLLNQHGGAGYSIVKLDGTTGQVVSTYASNQYLNECCLYQYAVVHPNGTLFAVQSDGSRPSVIGINLSTGSPIFTVPLPVSPTVEGGGVGSTA